jgi:hypothetical protein
MASDKSKYRGINDMYYSNDKNEDDSKKKEPENDPPAETPKKKEPEYRITELECAAPAQGWNRDCAFIVKGKVVTLVEKPTNPNVRVSVNSVYKGKKDCLADNVSAPIKEDKTFECEIGKLWYNNTYLSDKNQPADATFDMKATATGSTAEKPFDSATIKLPQESEFVVLSKGKYDNNGAKKYDKPESGDDFVPKNPVKELQKNLITTAFLPKDSDDGFFLETTEKAVRQFQEFAMKKDRLVRSKGKLEQSNSVLDIESANGIVDTKTNDELVKWVQGNMIKPIPKLYHGEVDDTGVSNGKGKKGSDEHHEGNLILELQKDLKTVGVYTDCREDGWFHDKMRDSISRLFEAYSCGAFVDENDNSVELPEEERMQFKMPGAVDAPKKEAIQKLKDKKLKVPKSELTGSVGEGGKNNGVDVKLIKKRLKELSYQIETVDEKLTEADIKAIKFFQAANMTIKKGLVKVDWRIDRGGSTEKTLLGEKAKKYEAIKKGSVKELVAAIETKKHNALAGIDKEFKAAWERIMKVWEEVSPYLPEGTLMQSGYRTKDEQRVQLYDKYKGFKSKIVEKFDDNTYTENYNSSQDETLKEDERNKLDKQMHTQICQAVSPREVALPGTSKHEKGNAIDTQRATVENRIRSLLWYSVEFEDKNQVLNITFEDNGCGHFEFK